MTIRYWHRDWRYEFAKRRENLLMTIVWHLPRTVVMWAAVRVATEDCEGNPCEQTVIEALNRWDRKDA